MEVQTPNHGHDDSKLTRRNLYQESRETDSLIVWSSDLDSGEYQLHGWTELTGQSVTDAVGNGWLAVVHPDDLERVAKIWTAARESSQQLASEFRIRDRDGQYRRVLARAVPIIRARATSGWIGAIFDTSKNRGDALVESESRFRAMFEDSGSGIALVDMRGHPVKCNPALEKLLGYSEAELSAMPFTEFTHESDRDLDWNLYAELTAGKRDKYEIEKRFITKDKRTIWASLVVSLVRDPTGSPRYAIGMVQDITERKRAEEELRSSEERFAKAFQASPEPISIYRHRDGMLLEVNERWTKVYGYSREEAIGHTGPDLTVVKVEDRDRVRSLISKGSFQDVEIDLKTKQGTIRNISLSAEQISIDGELCNLYLHRDVTQQRRIEGQNKKLIHDLGERVKELTALHHTARILQETETHLMTTLSQTARLLPPAFQFPEITAARVRLGDHEAVTPGFSDALKSLRNDFKTVDGLVGSIEVVYTEECPPAFEGPFLAEERALIDTLCEMLRTDYDRRQSEKELRKLSDQLRALADKLRSAREEEGIRIARELHDELGSALTSVKWSLMSLSSPLNADRITEMTTLIDNTINSVRRISSELRPSVLDDLGLLPAIEWHAQQFQSRTGIVCRIDALNEIELNSHQATAVFRIFQEGLTNILRHANASEVNVLLSQDDQEFTLEIKDNGRGITEEESLGLASLGLLGMRERAQAVGGTLEIHGNPARGTLLSVRVPIGTLPNQR